MEISGVFYVLFDERRNNATNKQVLGEVIDNNDV